MVTKLPIFDVGMTKAVCDVLAQTEWPGLTNSEIDQLLEMVRVKDRESGANKRDSLFRTLHNAQVAQHAGNVLSAFVARALDNTRYTADPARRATLVEQLGPVLALHGYRIHESGRLARGERARTLSEAAELANSLRAALVSRGVHEELLRYCSEELLAQSLFHSISEAAKSIPARIRAMTGLGLDGADLYDAALGTKTTAPILRISVGETASAISEQRGFKHLLLGIHGHFRNPRAHRPRLDAAEKRQDLLDAFGLFSYIHRLLDSATVGPS